ncbi:hypothetical protein IGI04_041253 [Brassica rapa subsp. trilocularis]|uniref:F-box domain-containing protein n=1 Tax=Brassica rapa subsp. trilocularis TaxID=1813537 RepID=A0ABQ7KQ91_BRACM|nr:hypothetical protein IGI04_041253 [Brassica rapa subsp. trilocularis]
MLKRDGELLPDDVVELILERLPVVSLLRFMSVSKTWKSTIESPSFKQRQLMITSRKSRGPDVLYVTGFGNEEDEIKEEEANMVVGSCVIRSLKFPTRSDKVCYGTCDGLVCLFSNRHPSVVFNPATRWRRSFPLPRVQPLIISHFKARSNLFCYTQEPQLGFGKDKVRGTYKPVWLFNSSEFDLDNATTCEVFDFTTNAWRRGPPLVIHDLHTKSYVFDSCPKSPEYPVCFQTLTSLLDVAKVKLPIGTTTESLWHLQDPWELMEYFSETSLHQLEKNRLDQLILPKVMQVNHFGRSGRTKWTHLVNEDTTDWSNEHPQDVFIAGDKSHHSQFRSSNRFSVLGCECC